MSHELWNERSYSLREEPWHRLGNVSQEELGAVDAFSRIGSYDVEVHQLGATISGLTELTPDRGLFRCPTPDDPHYRHLGTVGPKYTLVPPLRFFEIWDEVVRHPVETMGVLGKGEMIFVTVKLPEIDLGNNDHVKSYMLVTSPYDGGESIYVRNTPIRTVCKNTLIAGIAAATESLAVPHRSNVEDRLKERLHGIYDRAVDRAETLKQFFTMLTQKRVTDLDRLTGQIYPDPVRPVATFSNPDPDESTYAYNLAYQQKSREVVSNLFNGLATGADLPTAAGTLWGLYNAVTEWEDYRRPKSGTSQAYQALFGSRAQIKAKAFDVVMAEVDR